MAERRMNDIIKISADSTKFPRTTNEDGSIQYTDLYDWTSGFFAGNLWYLYELTGKEYWKNEAERWTKTLEPLKNFTRHHDLGFMVYCSYGNEYRLVPSEETKEILIQSAESLCKRFYPVTGSIKSWDYRRSLDNKSEWFFPVIIDNMMNLELLFFASKVSGNPKYSDIAIKHAETTMKNHFRPNFSTYHVVNYDTITGAVLNRSAAQGYTDESTWARGQAWAIYGFTMTYRETGDERFLHTAQKAADFYLNAKDMPSDLIPYWDLNLPDSTFKPVWENHTGKSLSQRDASAAAIVASALLELCKYGGENADLYQKSAVEMLRSLSSDHYMNDGKAGEYFLLKHSVGSFPNQVEIDVPLVYADYYYIEALLRSRNL